MIPCRGGGPCGTSPDAGARSHSAPRCNTPYAIILRNMSISRSSCHLRRRINEDKMIKEPYAGAASRSPSRQQPRKLNPIVARSWHPQCRTRVSQQLFLELCKLSIIHSRRSNESWTRAAHLGSLGGPADGRALPWCPLPRRCNNTTGAQGELLGCTTVIVRRGRDDQNAFYAPCPERSSHPPTKLSRCQPVPTLLETRPDSRGPMCTNSGAGSACALVHRLHASTSRD